MKKNIIKFFRKQLEKAGYHVTNVDRGQIAVSEFAFPGFYDLSESDRKSIHNLMQFGSIIKEKHAVTGNFGHFILEDLSVLVGKKGIGKTMFLQQAIKQLSPEKRVIIFTGESEEYARLSELKPCIECYSMDDIIEIPVEFATSEDWKREPKEIYLEKLMSSKDLKLMVIESDYLFTLDDHILDLIIGLTIDYEVQTCLVTSDLKVVPKLFEFGKVDMSRINATVEGLLNDQ